MRIWRKHLNKISILAILFIIVVDYSKFGSFKWSIIRTQDEYIIYIWKLINSFVINYSKFFQIFLFHVSIVNRLTSGFDRYYLKILNMIRPIRLFHLHLYLHETLISKIQTGNAVYGVEFAGLKTFRPSWIH